MFTLDVAHLLSLLDSNMTRLFPRNIMLHDGSNWTNLTYLYINLFVLRAQWFLENLNYLFHLMMYNIYNNHKIS